MAGLVPAIHALLAARLLRDVDARDKRGHDGTESVSALSRLPLPTKSLHGGQHRDRDGVLPR
jgi:hypothetical protein